ncbi:MAG: copper-binding protein [Hyphomicrobiaceae bacterium]
MDKNRNIVRITLVVFLTASFATVGITDNGHKSEHNKDGMDHSQMDHSKMEHGVAEEVTVAGTVNKIDAAKNVISITHEPVPSIGWPKMTMDIPVTKRVDLSTVETGKPVEFTLKQGRDKTYRVIGIETK